jgi:hypothetical protein
MSLQRPRAWQRVAALAPLLLVLVSLPSQVLLRCRMDGLLRDACCCPRASEAAPPAGPTVASDGCCKSETAVRQLPVARTTPPPDATPAPVAIELPPARPETVAIARSVRPSAPAREGPRILLLKQAFLI